MYSLTFNKTKKDIPIAIVKGGTHNGEVLYLHNGENQKAQPVKKDIDFSKYQSELKHLKPRERVQTLVKLQEALEKNVDVDDLVGMDVKVKTAYDRMLKDSSDTKSVELPINSYFSILPTMDKNKREIFYIAGASGSGKSWLARGLAENYKQIWGDKREVYLISKLKEDETLDNSKCKINRIDIETFKTDPPTFEEFTDSLVIFDDYDTLDEPYSTLVTKLIDDIAIMGRHAHISMLCLTHHITNYKKTRLLLNEATHVVIYPHGSSFSGITYLLKTNVGMDVKDIKEIKNCGSRYVLFSKHYPPYMIGEHFAKLIT